MNEVEYHELEFTSWECNKANTNATCAKLEPVMGIQAVLDPCTKVKIGLFFQHKINLNSSKGIILNCTAEHVFISPEIFSYCFTKMKELIETAHRRFTKKLLERSVADEISFTLNCEVNDFEVEQVLNHVKK